MIALSYYDYNTKLTGKLMPNVLTKNITIIIIIIIIISINVWDFH